MQRIKKAYAENGDLKIIPETPPLDGSENWEQGRGAYYELDNDPNTGDPLALDIDREQDNYFKNVISNNIKHWQENAYPNWFDDIEYPKNATVKYTDGNIYVSKIDNNTALPTNATDWKIYDPSSLDLPFVKLTGDETIAGIKTFSSSPIAPTPTTDFQVATKKYVDDIRIGLIDYGYVAKSYHIVAFGGEFNRADYPKLWAYLQTNPTLVKTQAQWTTELTANDGICGFYSSGNGTTTFRVPNLDKAFLRPDNRGVGSYQADMFKSHDHGQAYVRLGAQQGTLAINPGLQMAIMDSSFTGGTETRPKNIAVLPLIVAK